MMSSFQWGGSLRRLLLGVCLSVAVLPILTLPAAAQVRLHDAAAPVAVAYHLTVLFTQGRGTGTILDGQIAGSLGSTGLLTATLINGVAMTATVAGTVVSATASPAATSGVSLTVQGRAGSFVLQGSEARAGSGVYGGTVTQGSQPAGVYLMTPETSMSSYQFAARIRSGRYKGTTLSGTLAIAAARSGRFDGTLTLDDGGVYAATGEVIYGNLEVRLYLPGKGIIVGAAPKTVQTILGTTYTLYNGSFAGPGSTDGGAWSATPSS